MACQRVSIQQYDSSLMTLLIRIIQTIEIRIYSSRIFACWENGSDRSLQFNAHKFEVLWISNKKNPIICNYCIVHDKHLQTVKQAEYLSVLQSAQIFPGTSMLTTLTACRFKVSKGAKIRNQYNQVPHLTQNTSTSTSLH